MDLKERYYSICSKLLPIRPHDPADPSYLETLRQHDFNKARELERKQTVATLLARTAEQVKEEELLVAELRRKEANDRRWDRERASAKGVFAKLDAASPHERAAIIAGPMGPGMGLLDPKRNKKRREDGLLPPGAGGMGGGGGAGYPYAAQAGFRDRSHLSLATITLDAQTPLRTQRLNAGTTLQSSRMSQVKSTLVQKVQQVMQEEFGLGAAPNMPTQNIMFAYDEVRNAVAALVELRKQVEKVEHELKMANVRKQNVLQHGVGIVTGQTLDVTNKRPASSSLVHPRDKKQKR
ncbi:hypothetical protein M427DRAFT_350096 [Gonapodya prolifera JEL478]|uniref:DNA methyltransferase 1-associated 1 domain-containing protein n=1 Tax=Gonapodya prolifera (strain JEL478) TaxID=1344416 RepID=A0A139AWZ4_GONPJ|nr:hypothetical protein M427DRAFT_350096 [Gonapodya prolifera JEL478]|eukprot:KXS20995.1 hypothetical protein M427DRAFT_350096 [Gonapodya prolifera JEL478]